MIIAINEEYIISQYDIINVFLYADINTEIHMNLLTSLYGNTQKVGKLNKALYDLKQVLRLYNKLLSKILKELNFNICPYDKGVYINNTIQIVLLICYVDNIIIINKNNTNLLILK